MKIILIGFIGCLLAFNTYGQITSNQVQSVVSAIYKLEGGTKTKYPFGIKSIDTKGDYNKAKKICENTVKNHFARWDKWGKTNCYLISLSLRYCPPSDDKQGHSNWVNNVHKMLDKSNKKGFNCTHE